jgi:hypothetical protein
VRQKYPWAVDGRKATIYVKAVPKWLAAMSEELEELVTKELKILEGGLLMIEGIVEEDATKEERENEKGLVAREWESLDYGMSGDVFELRLMQRAGSEA